MTETDEWKALVQRIKDTELSGSPALCTLLDFLFKNRTVWLQAKEIDDKHFGEQNDLSGSHAREEIARLKVKLRKFARRANGEKWKCEVPDAKRTQGFQIKFTLVTVSLTPSEVFWQPHLDRADDTIVISGTHLFFFDVQEKRVLRYYDCNLNAERTDLETLEALKRAHPKCDARNLSPWADVYLASGDIHAHEALLRWFYSHAEVLLRRVTTRDISDREAHRLAPILIGRPQTNRFIAKIMSSRQGAHLRYQIEPATGAVQIRKIKPVEKTALSAFQVTKEGIISSGAASDTVFGIVSRLPNPAGYGFVTIIVSDYYAMVIARIVEAMTDDKHAAELLERMKWPVGTSLPDSFEMLFAVTISPGNLDGEGYPELLCWSSPSA